MVHYYYKNKHAIFLFTLIKSDSQFHGNTSGTDFIRIYFLKSYKRTPESFILELPLSNYLALMSISRGK